MKVYVTDPQFGVASLDPNLAYLCYSILVWQEGLPPIAHPPGNEETIIELAYGDSAVVIRQKIVDKIVATIGVSSNDIIFLGGWA